MIAVFLAMGFEEIEALAVVDILRRAELDVITIGIGGKVIRGSHGITVATDMDDSQVSSDDLEAVILPGGMPGTLNLEHSAVVQRFITLAVERGLPIGAICAAPSILGHRGLLQGRKAVCFPGYEQELQGAEVVHEPVVVDGLFTTARGAGVALEFGFSLVSQLVSPERTDLLRASMQC